MRRLLIPVVLLVSIFPGQAAEPPVREPRDAAVDRALKYLQKSQEKDGSWARDRYSPPVTALCVMAFLQAGHAAGDGDYEDTVQKGLEYVLKFKGTKADLIAGWYGNEMYQHGICTLMLAQALPKCKGKLTQDVKAKLEKAVAAILKGQRTSDPKSPHFGGWRYLQKGTDSDLSVSGWQIQALRAAKSAGCEVPKESLSLAIDYVRRCGGSVTGGFRYFPGGRLTVPCTASAVFALLEPRDAQPDKLITQAGAYVLKNPPRWGDGHFFYGTYYGSQAMFRLGGDFWKEYQPKLYAVLLDNQKPDGSWLGARATFGPNYCTAMAVLSLTADGKYKAPSK
jgi:hypothetical protein